MVIFVKVVLTFFRHQDFVLVEGVFRMRNRILSLAILSVVAASANAQVLYSTSFEAPTYTNGVSVSGVDGWVNGSGAGASQAVSNARAASGSQSLRFDNSTLNSFYSVRRPFTASGVSAATPLLATVKVYVSANNSADRIYGMYLSSSATGTLGSTVAGLTIGGNGVVRAGNSWALTYGTADFTAAAGSFADRWLTISFSYDGANTTASISGFGDGSSYSEVFTNAAPLGLNLGSDYITQTGSLGEGYFDDLSVSVVPEPMTMTVLALGAVAALRRRNRKS